MPLPRPRLGSCRRPSPSKLVTGCPHNTAETWGPLVPAADAASQEWLAGTPFARSPRASESGASCASGHDAPCREQTPCAVVHCEIGQPPIMKAQTHVRAGRQGGTAGHTAVTPLPPPCRADVTDFAGAKTFRVRVRGRDAPASARLERGKYRDKARPEG